MTTLQPTLSFECIADQPAEIESPQVLHDIDHLIQVWAENRNDLPDFFGEEFTITSVTRQPVFILSVEVQLMRRTAESFVEPYFGGSLDERPWSSNDLFQVLPPGTATFPIQPTSERTTVAGRQRLLHCSDCGSSGHLECTHCSATGESSCHPCNGSGLIACEYCNGSGAVVGTRMELEDCNYCDGNGTVECAVCAGRGHTNCSHCVGEGRFSCEACRGQGQLKQSWAIRTDIETKSREQLIGTSSAPAFASDLVSDSQLIQGGHIDLLGVDDWTQRLAAIVPRQVNWTVTDLATRALQESHAANDMHAKATALRAAVRGSYLYRIELAHFGKSAVIYMGGNSNRIFTESLPQRSQSLTSRLLRAIDRVFSKFGMGAGRSRDEGFLDGVRSQSIHAADRNKLAARLREFGMETRVNKHGYDLAVDLASSTEMPTKVALELRFTVNQAGLTLVSTRCDLGYAPREMFPWALEMNRDFEFGHIGLTEDPETTQERFIFVDNRPYEDLRAVDYYLLLMNVAENSHRIISQLTESSA